MTARKTWCHCGRSGEEVRAIKRLVGCQRNQGGSKVPMRMSGEVGVVRKAVRPDVSAVQESGCQRGSKGVRKNSRVSRCQ